MFTNFARCQLFVDFSDQIVRNDNSSALIQGSNAPCESSRIQISWKNGQHVQFLLASDFEATTHKLY